MPAFYFSFALCACRARRAISSALNSLKGRHQHLGTAIYKPTGCRGEPESAARLTAKCLARRADPALGLVHHAPPLA
jgi:hypothetical protein